MLREHQCKMHEQWMLAMIVLRAFFLPVRTESSLVCEEEKHCGCLKKAEKMEIKRVHENTTAVVLCPNLEKDEELISVSLYKGKEKLHFADMTNKTHESCGHFNVSKQNGSISYMIQGDFNVTGIYSCKIHTQNGQTKTTKQKNTILLVKDAQQTTEPIEPPKPCPSTLTVILYTLCGLLLLYDLIITVTASVLFILYKVKIKKMPENPYMNTRPVTQRRR